MAGGFVLWRSFMLGKLVGGYSGLDAAWALHHSLANLSQIFLGSGAVAGLALLSILLVAGRAIRGAPRHIPLLLAIAVAVLLPFIAIRVVMHVVDLRFAFLPWWAFSILFVLGLARWVDSRLSHPTGPSCPSPPSRWGQAVTRPTAALLAACVVLAVGLHRQAVFADIEKVSAAYDTQGKFLWSGDGNTGYVPYGDHSGFGLFGYGMSALRLQYQGSKAPQALSFPEVARQSGMPDVVYGYDAACRCMLPRSVPLPTPMARPDPEKPQSLTLLMDRRQGGLIWHVAAPAITECHMVVPARNVSSLIPCRGQLKFELPAWLSGEFRMYVRDGMGRWQRSDPLIFPQHGQWLVWPVAAP
jgi:hypothetical protein